MASLVSLKAEAKRSAKYRGHQLGTFKSQGKTRAEAVCKKCGAYVQVDTRPSPNGIDIGGTAVGLNCKK